MIFKYWHKFWFQEQSPLPVALFRIFFGFFVLQKSFMEFAPNFYPFFGNRGLVDTSTLCIHWWHDYPVFNIFLLLPPDNLCRLIFFWLFVVFVLFLTLGFCTRLSAMVVYCGLLSLDKQCPFTLNGSDDIMRLLSFLLIFSPAGAMYSIDFLLNGQRAGQRLESPWAQRMMQVQLCVAYFSSFLCKIIGDQWQHGLSVYYVSHLLEFQKFPLPWLTDHSPGYQILTYGTLATELAMATLVWYKPARYWVLLAGVIMHAGIDWTMNLPYFEFLFVSCYLNFIEPKDLERLINIGQKYIAQAYASGCRYTGAWCQNGVRVSRICNGISSSFTAVRASLARLRSYIQNSNLQFPLLFSALMIILISGAQTSNPLRQQYLAFQNKYNYGIRLFNTQIEAQAKFKLCAQLPDNNKHKLAAEEALASIWSLTGAYPETDKMLRHICQSRLKEKLPYNLSLEKAMSFLGDVYLETGHLDAAELCYQTILNYDLAHAPKSSPGAAISLNNLAVISYFRTLISPNKTARYLALEKTNNIYIQSLDKLHLSDKLDSEQATPQQKSTSLIASDILANQYLTLQDACKLEEAAAVKTKLVKLTAKFR